MAKAVTYYNPLQPLQRKTETVFAENVEELLQKLSYDVDSYDIEVLINQEKVGLEYILQENDIVEIIFVPKGGGDDGKSVLGIVASIVLTVVSFGAGGAASGFWAQGVAGTIGGTTGMLAGAAVYAVGSLAISSILAPDTPDLGLDSSFENLKSSPTYSWNTLENAFEQGKPIPVLYGTYRVYPPLISKHIENVGSKQYLNLLYAVNDGQANINRASVEIKGENISNFNEVDIYTRDGDNDQLPMSPFDVSVNEKPIKKKLSTDWSYFESDGNFLDSSRIGIVANRGLWYSNDKGGLDTVRVKIQIQYRQEGGDWEDLTKYVESSEFDYIIKDFDRRGLSFYRLQYSYTYYFYSFYRDALEDYRTGRRRLHYKRVYVDYGDQIPESITSLNMTNIKSDINLWTASKALYKFPKAGFDSLPYETISGRSREPLRWSFDHNATSTTKVEYRARFYEQPPTGTRYGSDVYLEFLQENLEDGFTYPNTALLGVRALATDQLNGNLPRVSTLAIGGSSNPAIAVMDILQRSGEELSETSIQKFNEWAEFCDEKNYTCNIYLDEIETVKDAVEKISKLGRAAVVQYGNDWDVIIDKADTSPVQGFLFTMGNISANSFTEEFLPIQDRANRIEITYWDKNAEYKPQILEVSNANYDTVPDNKKTSISLVGCTDRDMALKYAKYLLNSSRYLTYTASFEVDTEAVVCRVGDIVKVAHDVPHIGFKSGRITGATETQVFLDGDVDLPDERNYIEIRYGDTDEIAELEVLERDTTTDVLTFKNTQTNPPSKYDVYSVGTIHRATRKMRVLEIVQTSDLVSKLSCLEYVEEVYQDNVDIEPEILGDFLGLRGLSLDEFITYEQTSAIGNIEASWRGESLYYDVYLDGEFVERVQQKSVKIKNLPPETYTVTIVDSFGDEVGDEITILGRFAPPEPPTNFKAWQHGQVVEFSWTKSIDLDVKQYEIRHGLTWDTGFRVGIPDSNKLTWYPDMDGTYRFWIKSLDTSDVYSVDAVQYNLNVKNINNNLNKVLEYDWLDTVTEPCGETNGLIFVTGVGYIPIASATYDQLDTLTYEDLGEITYSEEPYFEGCVQDTQQVGTTKIRMFSQYSATSSDLTYEDIQDRTYETYPFDTYETLTTLVDMGLYYALSDDNITFTDWIEYKGIIDEEFRYIKFKYDFSGELEGSEVYADDFKAILDVSDIELNISGLLVENTKTVTYTNYGKSFYYTPFVIPVSKDSAIYPKITNITETSFDISAYDTGGNLTNGTFDITVKGY